MTAINWASLEDHIQPDGSFAPPTREAKGPHAKTQKFPCSGCGGSGVWHGRGKCFACGGKGYFLTSEQDRRNARLQRRTRQEDRKAQIARLFDQHHPGIREFLRGATWSPFLQEIAGKLTQYGALTEGQLAAVRKTMQTVETRRAERAVEREAAKQTVDLTPIRAMFETANGNGYKNPVYRAAGLVINRAPDHGKNPGALYVKNEAGDYLGKILGTEYTGKPAPALQAIAADPRGEAVRHGQRTGTCSCCGRTLTDSNSIEAGIGPICATKWGL